MTDVIKNPADRLLDFSQRATDLAEVEMNRGEYEVANAHLAAAQAYKDAALKARDHHAAWEVYTDADQAAWTAASYEGLEIST